MCGIFAYTGESEAGPILLEGLTSLEYRGYDSAGIYLAQSGGVKTPGAVTELRARIPAHFNGKSGIAHLRWATHGEPTEENAHPHKDCSGDVWVVHNGIVENYRELKEKLIGLGHSFASETDTEVIAHLVEEQLKKEKNFEKAVLAALNMIKGTYGLAIQHKKEPEVIIGARMGAPVVIGLGKGENFIASDPSPILKHTRTIVFLEDGEMAVIRPFAYKIHKLGGAVVDRKPEEVDWTAEEAQKGGYEHFMLKEIMDEPEAVSDTLRGRLLEKEGNVKLGGLERVKDTLKDIKRIMLVACGTASYAALAGKYMLEEYAGIPVEVDIGSEFRYRKPIIDERTAVIAVSQSGETADTLEAIREGKRQGALTLGIVNAVGSTIARETDAGVYLHAGPEISVASTKAYLSQLTALALLTVYFGRARGMSKSDGQEIVRQLAALPAKIQKVLDARESIEELAKRYADNRDFLFIGRKYNFGTAFEGALKLKETTYIHAEACGAGEMKHGHLAMIDDKFPTVAIATSDSVYEKMISNIQEIRARKGPVIAVVTEGNTDIKNLVTDVVHVPETIDILSPILNVVPLHLFAYYFAKEKGLNVDRPRNLAKSVTVE